MRWPERHLLVLALLVAALLAALPVRASAHVKKVVGQVTLTFGWSDEPAFSGSRNSVQVVLTGAEGAPISDIGGDLSVEVSFGDARIVLPLVPAGQPGEFRAPLVPTRPGTYAFHITGTVQGRAIDTSATCSSETFDCVTDVSEVQFPAKDPSNGELAARLARELPRVEEQARATAANARLLAIVAIAIAALALAAAIGLEARRARKSS